MMFKRCFASLLLAYCALGAAVGEAHKPITSKYTYNDDVFPILRQRCGECHVTGGIAPMSLLTYDEAYPWAESIRGELIAGHMPPAGELGARELDVVLTWATGGTPRGNPLQEPAAVERARGWPLGTPDVELPASEITLAGNESDVLHELTIATRLSADRSLGAIDVLPGTPAVVRNVTVALASNPDQLLAVWTPGARPHAGGEGSFSLPAGADLRVRIHYKKTYKNEGQVMHDRSAIGLYFAAGTTKQIRTIAMTPAPTTITDDVRAVSYYPDPVVKNAAIRLDLVTPDGTRSPLARLLVRPDWARRFWFDRPVMIPHGSRIEMVANVNAADQLLPPAAAPTPSEPPGAPPARVFLDVIPAS